MATSMLMTSCWTVGCFGEERKGRVSSASCIEKNKKTHQCLLALLHPLLPLLIAQLERPTLPPGIVRLRRHSPHEPVELSRSDGQGKFDSVLLVPEDHGCDLSSLFVVGSVLDGLVDREERRGRKGKLEGEELHRVRELFLLLLLLVLLLVLNWLLSIKELEGWKRSG